MKTCGSFTELKRPEVALQMLLYRFVLALQADGHLRHGADDGFVLDCAGHDPDDHGARPVFRQWKHPHRQPRSQSTIEDAGLLEGIRLWAVTPLGSLFICAVTVRDSDRLAAFLSSIWQRQLRQSRFLVLRTALQQYRYGVHKELRRHLLGGLCCHLLACIIFFTIRVQPTRRNGRPCPGNGRLELDWRAGVQYAGTRRLH